MEETPSDSQDSSDEPSPARTPSERDSDEPSPASLAKTPTGTPVGVDDPYEHVDRCDHLTDDGRCRFAFERFEADRDFALDRREDDYRCPVADPEGDWEWADCPHFRSTTDGTECRRCGLEERRMAHTGERPLIEEHHLSYAGGVPEDGAGAVAGAADGVDGTAVGGRAEGDAVPDENDRAAHEITVALCRWCHARVHDSWARIDDDVSPDPEAIAEREGRRGRELEEASFQSAAERFGSADARSGGDDE